ncbi:MAG: M20/M25/M40 family metallo-hydrolase [Vicinamibacterales bacterium]
MRRRDFLTTTTALLATRMAHAGAAGPSSQSPANAARATPASAAEARALAAVDDAADLDLLQRMIRMRSYSGGGEESPLARFLQDQMNQLGLRTRLIEVEPGRFDAVGVLPGTGGGTSLMLNGHIDTNPVGVGWTVDPFAAVIKDEMIYGIGVSNMKASCAAMYGTARAIVKSGTKLRGDLVLAFVVGELQGGVGTLKLIQEGVRADTFIVGEPTDLAVMTTHAADLSLEISTIGDTRHLSKMEEAISSIDTMFLVIERLKRMPFTGPDDEDARSVRRVNVGSMKAGLGREYLDWRPPQVPDFATIKASIRFGPGQSEESVLADVRRELDALTRENPKVKTELQVIRRGALPPPHAFQVPRTEPIVQTVVSAYDRVLGDAPPVGAVRPYSFYGSDASHLQHIAGMKGVVCGAGGKYNTMPDERVELAQFRAATRVYTIAAVDVCG